MRLQIRRIQPYWTDDGDYITPVDFALQMAPLLDSEFKPPSVWSERTIEAVPNQCEVTRFAYGDADRGVKVTHRIVYESEACGHAEDEVIVTCYGLPEGVHLELRGLRMYYDPRFVEIQVSGPEKPVYRILEVFDSHFGRERRLDSVDGSRLLETSQTAVRVHAWRAAELNALEALKHDAQNSEAMMYLGIARAAQGFEPEGENLLLASLTMNPKNHDAYYNLGLLALQQGRCLFASDAFRHGLNINPKNHPLLFQLGRALERLGMLNEALESYQQALIHSPNPNQDRGFIGVDFTEESRNAIERLQNASGNEKSETRDENCSD